MEGSVLDVERLASIAAMLYRIEGMFAERRAVSLSIHEMESGLFPIFAKLILVGRKRSGTGEEHFLAGMGAYPGQDENISGIR